MGRPPVTRTSSKGSGANRRKRLAPKEREEMIMQEAIRYFGEFGFSAPTRDLARRIGITQPLLYRYFPNKGKLIERMFEELVSERWNPEWERRLLDRSSDIAERLTDFYVSYTEPLFSYERMRTFMFMWLASNDLQKKFAGAPNSRLFRVIAEELRIAFDLPGPATLPITRMEEELVWGLQGSIMYLGIREFVFGFAPKVARRRIIRAQIDIFLRGVLPELNAALDAARPRKRPAGSD